MIMKAFLVQVNTYNYLGKTKMKMPGKGYWVLRDSYKNGYGY